MSLKRAVMLTLAMSGCVGTISGDAIEEEKGFEYFECDAKADQSSEIVTRLTPTQYRNALKALLARAYGADQAEGVLSNGSVAAQFAALPNDGSVHRGEIIYDSMDQRISPLLVTPQFEIATALGEWISQDAGRLSTFARTYAGDTACANVSSDTCVNALIDGFGRRALRRPLDDDDRAQYRGAYDDTDYGGHKALIASLLMSPDFIFRTEFRGEAVGTRSDLTKLTAYETASRVSFAVTNAPPDDELLAAAAADFKGEGQSLEEQLARLMQSPAARTQFQNFFKQWLRLDRINGINPSAAEALELEYPDHSAASLPAATNLQQLRLDAFNELVELMSWYAEHGSLRDAVLSDVSFARTDSLAQIYGVPVWDGDAGALVHFPEGQRAGLFNRTGYLLSGYPETNPVMRGARLRVEYLCDKMEPPANTAPPAGYVTPTVPTVRAVVEGKTQMAGTACIGCHKVSINPLGFPLETYDAFGRYRTQEPLYDVQGNVSRWEPINATTVPAINRDGTQDTVNNGVELSKLLADSQRLHACYARHVFRYLQGRAEELEKNEDACALQNMQRAATDGSLQDVVRALTQSSAFTRRRMPAGN